MAEKLELFMVSKQYIDITKFIAENASNEIALNEIFCIDNWQWENLNKIKNNYVVHDQLHSGKIVWFEMESPKYKHLGAYIEKFGDTYLYCFYGDLENFSTQSFEHSSNDSRIWFDNLYSYLVDILISQKLDFEYIAIGIEAFFQYATDIEKVVCKSKNIMSWIINNKIKHGEGLFLYTKKNLSIINSTIWEQFPNE